MANYIQSSTGTILTDQQVASGNFPAGTFFIELGTGVQKTKEQILGYSAPVASTPTSTPSTPSSTPAAAPTQAAQPTNSNIQYYQTPQGAFARDIQTGQVQQVVSVPPGSAVIQWNDPNLPSILQAGLDSGNMGQSTEPEGSDFSGAQGGTAVVDGYGLAQFSDSPGVIWLLDGNNKTMRRFADGAFNAIYANTPSVKDAIRTISSEDLSPGGAFSGWTPFTDQKYNVKSDGSMLQVVGSASQIQARYGNSVDTTKEQEGVTELDNFFGLLKASDTGIPSAYITQALQDPTMMGFYINARSYGGYTLGDVYKDIMARYLTTQGVTDMSNTRAISPTMVRTDYISTPEGQKAQVDVKLQPPSKIGNLDSEALKYAVGAIPDSLFRVLVPIADPNSPEFKQSMEQVNTAFYDVLLANLSAQSEEEHAQAKYMWDDLRSQLQTTLGISLSNDAMQAWNQFQSYEKSAAGQGIQGSGLEQDAIDTYLQTVRKQDQVQRASSLSQQDQKDMSYYLNYATPDEIAALDPVKRQKWGLEPSQAIKDQISFAALRAKYPLDKYPTMTDDVINGYVGAIIDPSGFYRSALYSKHAVDTWNTQQQKTTYQQGQVTNDALNKESEAYKTFTKSDSPFLRYTGDTSALSSGSGTTQTPDQFTNILQALQSTQYAPITPGGSTNTPPAPTGNTTGSQQTPAAGQTPPTQTPPQLNKVVAPITNTPAPNMSTNKGPVYVPAPQIPAQNQSKPITAPVSVFSPSTQNQSKPAPSIWNSYKPSTVGGSTNPYVAPKPQTLGDMFSPFTKLFSGMFGK